MKYVVFFASVLLTVAVNAGSTSIGESHIYKRIDGQELHLFAMRPPPSPSNTCRPAMVLFHGGGWVGGKVSQFEAQARHFTARGIVCFLVEYRFVPQDNATPPTPCIHDARSALRWVRRHAQDFGIDPHRIAATGASAGGHLAAHAALVDALNDPSDDLSISPRPDALLLFNPVLDNGPGQFGAVRIGDRVAEFSPAHNVTPGAPPTLLFLGSQDKLISVAIMERFRDAMRSAGTRCELVVYEGQEHGFFNSFRSRPHFELTLHAADEFLQSLGWLAPIAK